MRHPKFRPLRLAAGLAVLALATTVAIAAEREPRARPAVQPVDGVARVIVSYKATAALMRQHALAAQATRETVAAVYQQRADVLGKRAGIALRVGRAVGERAHAVTATGISSEALAQKLAADPDVEYAQVNHRQRALFLPNDPLYASGPAVNLATQTGGPVVGQWYLRSPTALFKSAINAEAAWDRTQGSPNIVVAVLDTGVRYDHVDLQGRLLPGYDMISDAPTANDGDGRDSDANDPGDWITSAENASGDFKDCGVENSSWHGTHVATIVGAATNNGIGMAGVAPGVQILPVRVLGKCGGYDSDIVAGMLWAAGIDQQGLPGSSTPARVLNMSLGSSGTCSPLYVNAISQVNAKGAVVVAAAGNSAGHAVGRPANCDGMIAVAGLRHAGSKVGFSDLGPEITIAAPGGNCVNILSGEPCLYPIVAGANSGTQGPLAGGSTYTDSFNVSVGTSFSAPQVAGVAALMLSVRPDLTPAALKTALRASARPFPATGADNGTDPAPVVQCVPPTGSDQLQCYCTTALCGAGMLDAAAAVAAVVPTVVAAITASPAAPMAGATVVLSGAAALASGRSVATWNWSIVSGASVAGLISAINAQTATLQANAAGTVVVRLTVTDDQGATGSIDTSIPIAAAPVVTPPATGGSSGGGAMSAAWLALLALAGAGLRRRASSEDARRAPCIGR
jgi:serine protease